MLLYALNEEAYFNSNIFCLPISFTISKTISGELPYGYKTLVRKFDFSKICQEQSEWVIDICVNKPLLPLCNTTIASQNSDYIVIHTVAIWTLFFTGIVKLSSFCRLFQRVELFELRFVPKMQHKYFNLYEVHSINRAQKAADLIASEKSRWKSRWKNNKIELEIVGNRPSKSTTNSLFFVKYKCSNSYRVFEWAEFLLETQNVEIILSLHSLWVLFAYSKVSIIRPGRSGLLEFEKNILLVV